MSIFPKHWGEYPPEYNREIHGPYNPSMYYGKRDTPFSEVKLGELASWIGRRKKTPRAVIECLGRAFFRYQINWVHVKNPGGAFLYQVMGAMMITGFLFDYKRFTAEKRRRYH